MVYYSCTVLFRNLVILRMKEDQGLMFICVLSLRSLIIEEVFPCWPSEEINVPCRSLYTDKNYRHSLGNFSFDNNMLYLCQELACHGVQGLFWPGSEPVYGRVVDQTRKVSATGFEYLTDRGHGQDNVEVIGCLLDKVRPHTFLSVRVLCFCRFISYLFKVEDQVLNREA